ncbi:FAD-binding domain-containing protein [Cognatishimia sp. F0-27]|uniref:FAD-binding domain-containing protein n=1 Tax=Cognatishimia sp. F0-27 TaxID=2816855 RepID=UPI001D0C55CE|nr:FAD-binding domain-containing protein [Cognatishimia sp. F0-27]MCC1491589.1 deoxyribodipyrimidine photo-lyase [Cognatishimia sp. F0-27]
MATILWFKRDLRLADNAALLRAVALGDPIPVFIVEPDYWQLPDTSGRHYAFLRETVLSLREALRACGSDLVIRVGAAVPVLETLRRETGASVMVSHAETGNGWTFARDRQVAAWARDRGVRWEELPASAVIRGPHDRDRWAAHRNAVMAAPALAAPCALPAVALHSDPWPETARLGLHDPCPERQPGGHAAANQTLESFLDRRGQDYRRAMSSPLSGATACSRLSPHIALGALSIRQITQATAARQRAVKGTRTGWSGSLSSYQSRLAWRDHFIQKLEDEPALEWRALHRAYDRLRPETPDAARLDAWAAGETGVPFVDACMRSLRATGWLNFRMRAMVTSFASYHLWLPWQASGTHLARMFTDYEPGIHWSQIQMQSGTTGINTLRIYNPVKQGRDQDPDGVFTRAWVPEVAHLPDAVLQEPWRAETPPARYPPPLVDVAEAARAARAAIGALRRDPAHGPEAARVVKKHASRKDRHFVNDRAPKRRARGEDNPAQARFDF